MLEDVDALASPADWIILTMEVVGTIAFAVSGAMAGARARLDWLGVVVLAVVVSVGGGTLRDLMLDIPIDWTTEAWPLLVATGTAVVVIALIRQLGVHLDRRSYVLVADATGLAAFSIVGVDVALETGVAPLTAALLGVVTGVGGGVIRDVLVNQRPTLLSGEIYAVAAGSGTLLYVGLLEVDLAPWVATWLSMLVILGLRLTAISRSWSLPLVDPPAPRES